MSRMIHMLTASLCLAQVACAENPWIVAHRGLLQHAPENTLANFRACLELRLGFEFDVERTRDGQLVCIHDSTVDRTTDGTGRVSELTLSDLRRLDAGSWFDPQFTGEKVPTVEEVLSLIAAHRQLDILIAVDLKAEGVEQEVVRLAEKHEVLHCLLFIGRTISEPEVRRRIKQASAKARTATVANTPEEFPRALTDRDSDWVYFRFLPTREQMKAVHSAGRSAFIAGVTVSGHVPENWRSAVDAGVNGLLTDYPLEARTMLRSGRQRSATTSPVAP